MNKMNHFFSHFFSEKRQNEQNEQNEKNEQNEQNEQNESFYLPPLFCKKQKTKIKKQKTKHLEPITCDTDD
jgi:hypothetical protein